MIKDRWRSTRARLSQETGTTDATGLWSRIDASRRAGESVELPSADPRRPVTPVLLGVLAVAAVLALATLRDRADVAPIAAISSDADDAAAFDWLTTPAYAQGNGTSDLPPIDPPDLDKVTPRRLVYQHMGGADGFITQKEGTDTLRISRDTANGVGRLLLVQTNRQGVPYVYSSSLDSIGLAVDGRLLFWDWQISKVGKPEPSVTMVTTLLPDSVRFTFVRRDGTPQTSRVRPANYQYQIRDVLLGLLPAIPLQLGYARSVSVMDLVRGETTPGFTRSVEMRVTGKTWVNLPIGRFHCWVVAYSVVPEPGEKRYTSKLYVDMASGSLVRAEWKTGESFIAEQSLVDWQVSR